ncbi:MAG: hypothetical protein ACK41Y_00960 [Paracoccus hibiscisoli]|uniref:hypothetical protein n=1 Tax=Paracoccus hibiscisoli TaxID=2023261 RepID=UPI00391BC069
MLKTPFKALLVGTQIAAASLLATTAIAQTTQVETPAGTTVIVPDAALQEEPSQGFVLEGDYPRLESIENYETIAETLSAQGYSDIYIQREGPILTITAQRAGVPIELVYSTANARLVSVDGVETRRDAEGSSAGDITGAATGSQSGAGSDATDDAGADTDGADADTGADTGTDAGGDADGGADGDADGGADGGSDTDGGSDSDGGESDGGSDSEG